MGGSEEMILEGSMTGMTGEVLMERAGILVAGDGGVFVNQEVGFGVGMGELLADVAEMYKQATRAI